MLVYVLGQVEAKNSILRDLSLVPGRYTVPIALGREPNSELCLRGRAEKARHSYDFKSDENIQMFDSLACYRTPTYEQRSSYIQSLILLLRVQRLNTFGRGL
jgi:hypothetical protein